MLEADTTFSVLQIFRIFRFTGAFPIEDDGWGGIGPLRSRSYLIWHYILAACHCMVTFYSGIRLVQSLNMSNSIGDKVFHSLFLASYTLSVAFKLTLQINQNSMVAFLNFCFIPKEKMLESFGIHASTARILRGKPAEKVLRLALKFSWWIAVIQSGLIALSITQAKCSPRYLLSLMDDCLEIPMAYVLLLLPYEFILWMQGWAMFILYATVIVIWLLESGYWLSIAEWQQLRILKGKGKAQEFRRFMSLYKRLQILNINFSDMLQQYFWPIEQTMMMAILTVMYFIVVKLHAVLPVFLYAFLTVPTVMGHGYTFFCYHKIAIGAERSKQLLTRWRMCKEWNLIKREVEACRKLDDKVGGCYSFGRCSNLVFSSLMVQILCTLLIALE